MVGIFRDVWVRVRGYGYRFELVRSFLIMAQRRNRRCILLYRITQLQLLSDADLWRYMMEALTELSLCFYIRARGRSIAFQYGSGMTFAINHYFNASFIGSQNDCCLLP